MNNLENIKNRIREIRKDNKLNQSQFADLIGVGQSCVSKWEQGITIPTTEDILKIATTLDVSADFILSLSEY